MSVRTRLALFTAFLVALMLGLGTIAVIGDQAASHQVNLQARTLTPTLTTNASLQSELRRAERSVANYVLLRHALTSAEPDPDTAAKVLGPARSLIQSLPGDLDGIDHLVSMPPLTDTALVGNLADLVNAQRAAAMEWRTWAMSVVPEVGAQPGPLPSAAEVRRGEDLFEQVMSANSGVQALLASANAAVRQDVLDRLDDARMRLLIATLAAVALALFVAWRATARLVGPVEALGETIRRQVAGERGAWADTESGAKEIRELALGINVLNREHLSLVDRQAQSLALLRAGNDAVAMVVRAGEPQGAVDLVTETVGRTLGVDAARIAGWSSSGEPFAAVWSRSKSTDVAVPETWWRAPSAGAPLLPAGEVIAVGSPGRTRTSPTPDWVNEDPVVVRSASSLFLPIAVGETVFGLLSVHSRSDSRNWDEPEVAYLQRVTRELARLCAARRTD